MSFLREDASRLEDVVTTSGSPAGGSWILLVEDIDNEELLAILLRDRDGAIEPPMVTVVLEFVDHVIERHERVVDGDHFHIGVRRRGTEHELSNTTESINAQLCRQSTNTNLGVEPTFSHQRMKVLDLFFVKMRENAEVPSGKTRPPDSQSQKTTPSWRVRSVPPGIL